MATDGVEGLYLETHNWGRTVAFWQQLGFVLEFETAHRPGQLRHPAGGRNLLTTAGRHSPEVSWEAVRAAAPDVLLVMPCGFDLPRTLAELPLLCRQRGFDELPAVRHGRVYALDDSLELVAHLLHPQYFPLPPPMVQAPAFRRWCAEDPPRSTAHRPA